MLPALLRPAAAFGGAGADKIALHVREAAEYGNHQSPGASAGVGPRLGERAELRLGVDDLLKVFHGRLREGLKNILLMVLQPPAKNLLKSLKAAKGHLRGREARQ